MTIGNRLVGLVLKVGPLGENDRLITFLSEQEGISRLAVPGARRPKSKFAAAAPLTFMQLDITGRTGLRKVRQIKVLKSYTRIGTCLESLAGAQAIAELTMMLVGGNDPATGLLNTILVHLDRLEKGTKRNKLEVFAQGVQALMHILAIGGYAIPVQSCCKSGVILEPPIGQWEWRCSLLPDEGFAIGTLSNALIQLNPSELALLQRLMRSNLPLDSKGNLLGPKNVWKKLLTVIEIWINSHLPKKILALEMLQDILNQ